MKGAWVVYCDGEGWGGGDMLFATEATARAWINRPLEDHEVRHKERMAKLGYDDDSRREHVRFVRWGTCAGDPS